MTFSPPFIRHHRPKIRSEYAQAIRDAGRDGYAAAGHDATLSNFDPLDRGPHVRQYTLRTIRARCVDFDRNNPLAGALVNVLTDAVIGRGIRCRPDVDAQALGMREQDADSWNRQALDIWESVSDSPQFDISGQRNFYATQWLAFRTALTGGDCFVVLPTQRRRDGCPVETRTQLIDPGLVSNPYGQPERDGYVGGIRSTPTGEPVSYAIRNFFEEDAFSTRAPMWQTVQARTPGPPPLRNVLHIMRATRPGQVRGIPLLARSLTAIHQLGQYTTAELEAARLAACYTLFVKSEFGQGVGSGYGIPSGGATSGWTSRYPPGYLETDFGKSLELMPGDDVSAPTPGRPSTSFGGFATEMYKIIGASTGIPYEVFTMDFRKSFSASKAALMRLAETVATYQAQTIDQICSPVFQTVICYAAAIGLLPVPDAFFANYRVRRAFLRCRWIAPHRPHLEPAREITALVAAVKAGLIPASHAVEATSGMSFEAVQESIAAETRLRNKLNVKTEEKKK